MKVLYVRVSDEAHAYIAAMSAHSGVTMSGVTNLVLDEARRRGWQIDTSYPRITDIVESPAASPRSPAAGLGPGSIPLPLEPGPPGGTP